MTTPLKVAVMGAGAVGCYFGGMLARAGHEVTVFGTDAPDGCSVRLVTADWVPSDAARVGRGPILASRFAGRRAAVLQRVAQENAGLRPALRQPQRIENRAILGDAFGVCGDHPQDEIARERALDELPGGRRIADARRDAQLMREWREANLDPTGDGQPSWKLVRITDDDGGTCGRRSGGDR